MTENERLKTIRAELKLTQRAFSESLEIKQGSYSDVERGKAGISALLLKNLIRKYRVNPLWLCEGDGEMFLHEDNNWCLHSRADLSSKNVKHSEGSDDYLQLLQREQQYISSIQEVLDFLSK
ncbi:MAG: helix-turn-helix transcriptional regulator [Tenuifilaceae bacterium]|jgi:transcriptional regulator with XRE-family HTH domain|nr:helix-turn-helix transcriptional regulator [Tenuifilaceae bacterium]